MLEAWEYDKYKKLCLLHLLQMWQKLQNATYLWLEDMAQEMRRYQTQPRTSEWLKV